MPDGYEAHMCEKLGGFDTDEKRFVCEMFDPLNASDADFDPDEDGFDVNRDGFMSVNELLTSPEEYLSGPLRTGPTSWMDFAATLQTLNHPFQLSGRSFQRMQMQLN